MNLDYRAIRLRTRHQQGLGDDLPVDIVDDVVRIARGRKDSTSGPRRSIAALPTSTSDGVLMSVEPRTLTRSRHTSETDVAHTPGRELPHLGSQHNHLA